MTTITKLSKGEFGDWLVDSQRIKLDKYTIDGILLQNCGWRFHFTLRGYGLTCVDEHSETFHILNDRMLECSSAGNQVWARYKDVVLLYTRV